MIDHRAAAPKAASFSTFGDLLRYLRRRARFTQRDLALAVGYSPEHISRLEHNQRVPDQATLRALFIGALRLEHEEALAARLLELAAQRQTVSAPRHTPATTAMPASSQPMALPVPVTPLVGREAELAQIAQLVHTPACRVLTLVGLGGSGKTRLAIATGHEQAARFRHGAVFVPLAALQSPDLVISAIANALGIQISGQVPPLEQVQRFLRDKQILLIMDNAEHLAAGMDVLSPVLHQAPGVKLLLTSRERLHLQGEWVVEVHMASRFQARPALHIA